LSTTHQPSGWRPMPVCRTLRCRKALSTCRRPARPPAGRILCRTLRCRKALTYRCSVGQLSQRMRPGVARPVAKMGRSRTDEHTFLLLRRVATAGRFLLGVRPYREYRHWGRLDHGRMAGCRAPSGRRSTTGDRRAPRNVAQPISTLSSGPDHRKCSLVSMRDAGLKASRACAARLRRPPVA
jgi:hypothetical protein